MRPVKQKQPRIKVKAITDSARGEQCTLRIGGVCNFDPSTTVFAHMNGAGWATKHHDIHGCYACSNCHDWFDQRLKIKGSGAGISIVNREHEMLRAMIETQRILIEKGLIKI